MLKVEIFASTHGFWAHVIRRLTKRAGIKMASVRLRMGVLICAGLVWGSCYATVEDIGFHHEESGVSREIFYLKGEPSDVAWVVQVSDLHISSYHPERSEDLRRLLAPALKMIQPSLVLITGDLTDAKNRDRTTTRQDESEWIEYQKSMDTIIKESGIEKRAFFDVRGNHDKYGVPYVGSYWDFFSQYSISAQLNRTSTIQSITLMVQNWKYLFVGVDDSMSIGLRGPSNLFGHPSNSRIQKVDSELGLWDSESGEPVAKIVFGHFPMSFTASTETGKRYEDIFAKHSVTAYICGHLHAKFGKQLWKHHFYEWHDASRSKGDKMQGQFWEWELGDWRVGRMIRVIAIDGGQTSFVDVDLSSVVLSLEKALPTIILPTYPLDSRSMQRIMLVGHESISINLDNSTSKDAIRALIFSEKPVLSVTAKIFDSSTGTFRLVEEHLLHLVANSRTHLPLYQTAWNANKYSDSSPTRFWLQIVVIDNFGRETASMSRPFSVNCKQGQLDKTWLASFVMDIRWEVLYLFLLWGNISLLLSLLLFPKLINYYLEKNSVYQKLVFTLLNPCSSRTWKIWFFFPLWVLIEGSRNTKLWWANLIYLFYLLNFPWFWGYATVEDHPVGSMSLQGWTIQFVNTPSPILGIGVPDIMGIVIPFMYMIVTPSFILVYCLSAERKVYHFHVNSKSKCRQEVKLTQQSLAERMCVTSKFPPKSGIHLYQKVSACSICRGWIRATLLTLCLGILWLHWRQCYFLKGAFGAKAVIASPGFSWPPPVLLAAAVYSTWSAKNSVP
eukprot:Gb_41602 [translate_table: standard]